MEYVKQTLEYLDREQNIRNLADKMIDCGNCKYKGPRLREHFYDKTWDVICPKCLNSTISYNTPGEAVTAWNKKIYWR